MCAAHELYRYYLLVILTQRNLGIIFLITDVKCNPDGCGRIVYMRNIIILCVRQEVFILFQQNWFRPLRFHSCMLYAAPPAYSRAKYASAAISRNQKYTLAQWITTLDGSLEGFYPHSRRFSPFIYTARGY